MGATENKNIWDAYAAGKMNTKETSEYREWVFSGKIGLPIGVRIAPQSVLDARAAGKFTEEDEAEFQRERESGRLFVPDEEKESGFFESVTGAARETPESRSLTNWFAMPEMSALSLGGLKTIMGSLGAGTEELVDIIQDQNPHITVRYDAKGNPILKSANQREYVIPPGMTAVDLMRGLGLGGLFTGAAALTTVTGGGLPAAMLGAGVVSAGAQAGEAAMGGTFDPGEIALDVAGEAFVPGLKRVGKAIKRMVTEPTEEVTKKVDLSKLAGLTGRGGDPSKLAKYLTPDPKVEASLRRLNLDVPLGPKAAANEARELIATVGSRQAGALTSETIEAGQKFSKKAVDILEDWGGDPNISALDPKVKSAYKETILGLDESVKEGFAKVSSAIPKGTRAPAKNLLDFIDDRAKDLDGFKNLSPMEKKLYRKLSPVKDVQPTYALIDDIRKGLTEARVKKTGPFKDASSAMISRLEKLLLEDQRAVAATFDVLDEFNQARYTTAIRKSFEKEFMSLFGKDLGGSIVGKLGRGVKKLSEGDVSTFIKTIKAIPEKMRQEVAASGIYEAFGKNAADGNLNFKSFADWYRGLIRNKKAYTALMTNLPPGSRKQLSDIYRVANGFDKYQDKLIRTGKINDAKKQIEGAGRFMENIWDVTKRAGVALPFELLAAQMDLPKGGAMLFALGSALRGAKNKPSIIHAVDELFTSPQFLELVKNATPESASKLVKISAWKKFAKEVKDPVILSHPERWILSAFQAAPSKEEQKKDILEAKQRRLLEMEV